MTGFPFAGFRGFAIASLLVLGTNASARPIYEFSAVASSAQQSPAIDTDDASMAQLCIELDRGHSAQAIARTLRWPLPKVQARIDALVAAQLLRREDSGAYTPMFVTVTAADAKRFHAIDPALVDTVAAAVERQQSQLQDRFMRALHVDADQARPLSLIALGDVLFDRWQVRNVRKEFLPGFPPARAGKEFYLLASEDESGPRAALGFYSHSEQRYGDTLVVTFGHARTADPFAAGTPQLATQRIESYLAFARGATPASPELRAAGLVRKGRPALAVVSQADYATLPAITDDFRDELLRLLMADRSKIHAAYEASRYAQRVSFQEFALWWYHFVYADVIDRLIKHGTIDVPEAGYATLTVRKSAP
jgi:hypothetical protein